MTKKDFAKLQDELHQAGFLTRINRDGPKNYAVSVNFEITKQAKTRETCRRYIIHLHKELCDDN